MKKVKLAIVLAAILITTDALAQQQPLYSQYMNNDFVLNPAIAGTKDFAPLRGIIRNQWIGIQGAPNTQTLSFHNSIKDKNMGYGLFLYNDRIGPISQLGLSAAYSYRIKLGDAGNLSFGLAGQFYQYRIYSQDLKFDNQTNTDKVITNGDFRSFYPNSSFGVHYYADKYFASLSVPELFENKITTTKDYFIMKKKMHYLFTGGYKFVIDETYSLFPSLLVKYVQGAPAQIDFNVRLWLYEKFNVGISYRSKASVVILVGFKFKNQYHLGYSYDITTTNLKGYNSGSHEIMLGYDIVKSQSTKASF